MADEPSDEYREFVENLVPLSEAQHQGADGSGSPFENLAGRITGRPGFEFHFSFLSGAGFLLVAAALAAAMPGRPEGGFWRVGRDLVADLLATGNSAALPLALGALVLVLLAGLASASGGEFGRGFLMAQPFVGGAGVVGVGLLWVGLIVFVVANIIVLLLIILAYMVATILIIAFMIGMLIGLVRR